MTQKTRTKVRLGFGLALCWLPFVNYTVIMWEDQSLAQLIANVGFALLCVFWGLTVLVQAGK